MADEMQRMMQHSGRGSKTGIYSENHDDRNFDLSNADNIDPAKTKDNLYFGRTREAIDQIQSGTEMPEMSRYNQEMQDNGLVQRNRQSPPEHIITFAEQEKLIYERKFMGQYNRQMDAYRKKGNRSRIVDFETWRKTKRYCPEEVTYQIGKVGNEPDADKARDCLKGIAKAIENLGKKYNYFVLDAGIHVDESGIIHLHVRRVWYYVDGDGTLCIGQEKALEQAGVQLPDENQPVGRYNNRKMTFDGKVREMCMNYCIKKGFNIDKVPEKGKKHNRSKEKYLIDEAMDKLDEVKSRQAELDKRQAELDERERTLKQAELANIQRFGEIERLYNQVSDAAAQAELGPEVDALRRRLPDALSDQPQPTGPETEF